jgi:hypothetical protein
VPEALTRPGRSDVRFRFVLDLPASVNSWKAARAGRRLINKEMLDRLGTGTYDQPAQTRSCRNLSPNTKHKASKENIK